MRLAVTKEEFYANDNDQTKFVDRITAFLNIDFATVRIVGLVEGAYRRQLEEGKALDV